MGSGKMLGQVEKMLTLDRTCVKKQFVPHLQAKKLLQEQLRISRTLTEKTAESESDEEMEAPAQDGGLEDDEDKSDTYGSLLTSEDNPWKLDTVGILHQETSSSLDNGNLYSQVLTLLNCGLS